MIRNIHLFQRGVRQLEDINDGDQATIGLNNGQVEVVADLDRKLVRLVQIYESRVRDVLCIFLSASWTVVVGGAVSG